MKTTSLILLLLILELSSLFSQSKTYSFDWRQLKLNWPIRFDPKVDSVFKNGDPYLFPTQYTALNTAEQDFMGQKGHNGIDIGFNSFRPMDNNGAKVYAAATGILVAYRDSLDDRMNNPGLWEKFTPANKLNVTQIIPALKVFGIQNYPDGSGNVVYLQHANGFITQYAHLKKGLSVLKKYKLGDRIPVGVLLGIMGSSGASSNPHLHFGVYTGPQSLSPGAVIPTSGRISTLKAGQGWGYFVCPFYPEPAPSLENMWMGIYPTVYKPAQNGVIDVFDVAVAASNFNAATPPPNVVAIPRGTPIYVKSYTNGALGNSVTLVQIAGESGNVFDSRWSSTLQQGGVLLPNDFLTSANGVYYGSMQTNGQFCIYRLGSQEPQRSIWCTPVPAGNGLFFARMNENGTFAIYQGKPSGSAPSNPVWSSPVPSGNGPFYANLGLDANFCVYTKNSRTLDNNFWCAFSNTNEGVPNDCYMLSFLYPAQYVVKTYRQLPGSNALELRAQTPFSVLAGTSSTMDTLRVSQGINNQLTVGDQYNNGIENRTQFRAFLDQPDTTRSIQFAKFSMRLSGTTNLNPFTVQWGATMHLRATANGKTMTFFSPVTVVGRKTEGILFEPGSLFDPAFYGLSQWPGGGLPIDIQFEIKTNNNKQSDFITFDQVTVQYYYGGTTGNREH
jgi:murein DD-endopeptidase MepM/ murein hydrolase activator NlpD